MASCTGPKFAVLGPTAIEDYHAHLVRLDRTSRFPGADDRSIDAHCLDLIAAGAILIGAYVNGVMRAGAEIVPDRTARRAEAAITIENGYQDRGFERELTAHDHRRGAPLSSERSARARAEPRIADATRIPVLELHSYAVRRSDLLRGKRLALDDQRSDG